MMRLEFVDRCYRCVSYLCCGAIQFPLADAKQCIDVLINVVFRGNNAQLQRSPNLFPQRIPRELKLQRATIPYLMKLHRQSFSNLAISDKVASGRGVEVVRIFWRYVRRFQKKIQHLPSYNIYWYSQYLCRILILKKDYFWHIMHKPRKGTRGTSFIQKCCHFIAAQHFKCCSEAFTDAEVLAPCCRHHISATASAAVLVQQCTSASTMPAPGQRHCHCHHHPQRQPMSASVPAPLSAPALSSAPAQAPSSAPAPAHPPAT